MEQTFQINSINFQIHVNQKSDTESKLTQFDNNYLSQSSKSDEHYYFLNEKIKDLNIIYSSLNYHNEAVLEIGIDIINHCFLENKIDIKISKTGENELLIFREIDGEFNNIIIDEDADIEYLHIPIDRRQTSNEHFPFIYNTNLRGLVSKL